MCVCVYVFVCSCVRVFVYSCIRLFVIRVFLFVCSYVRLFVCVLWCRVVYIVKKLVTIHLHSLFTIQLNYVQARL